MVFVSVFLLASACVWVVDAQCPCLGCDTNTITCTALGLDEFPAISAADRQIVEVFRINQNGLTSLSVDDFANFTSLQQLYASSNNIHTIEPGTFSQTTQLEIVDFEDNNLQEFPQSLLTSAPNIESINLRDNNIETINEVILPSEHLLHADIDLTGDPINCDCGLRWLPDFLNSPQFLGTLLGTCSSPPSLSDVDLSTLTEDQLTCECSQACVNGACNMSLGQCVCDDGYTGENCSFACLPGKYGAGCLQDSSCVPENEASPCNHTNGVCLCLAGFTGLNCEEECLEGTFGQDCAEDCICYNGGLCDSVSGACTCTGEWSGPHCNISSCSDGVRNNDETDVDCGGSLCIPCPTDACSNSGDCEEGQVCLGHYAHPSNLLYPYQDNLGYRCVGEDVPGTAILQKFKDALRGRIGALSYVSPQANLSVVESSVQQEMEIQFGIQEPLESVTISTLEQAIGDPLYQAIIQWKSNAERANLERDIQQIISNIDGGLLKGTVLINRDDRKVVLNI